MKTPLGIAAAIAVLLLSTTLADARRHPHRVHYKENPRYRVIDNMPAMADCRWDNEGRSACFGKDPPARKRQRQAYQSEVVSVSHPPGCPRRAFCGCGVSVKVFGRPIRNLFLASNWLRFPRTTPAAGMVAARRGHVMYIMAMDANGNATVYDPNSGGHRTHIHTRSLAGYVVVNPHGSQMAGMMAL